MSKGLLDSYFRSFSPWLVVLAALVTGRVVVGGLDKGRGGERATKSTVLSAPNLNMTIKLLAPYNPLKAGFFKTC